MTRTNLLSLLLLIIFTITLLFTSRVNAAAVIGIDLGTEWIKVGLVKSGSPIDVVLNEQSKRKTAFMVGFRDSDRYFGEAARSLQTRFPDTMFKYLNLLIGKSYDGVSEVQQKYDQLYIPIRLIKSERGTISVQVNDKTQFSIEELFTMIFKYIKQLSNESVKGGANDCIITVCIIVFFSLYINLLI
jgi:hypoxia up-regulated 1